MTRRGWMLFLALCVIWGIPYLLIKVAVRDLSPASIVFLRTAIGAVLLLPVAAASGQLRALLPSWRWIIAYTVVEIAMPWVLLSDAERRLSSSLSGLLIAAVPVIGAGIAWLMRGERLDARRLGGLFVGLAGVVALLGFDVGGGSLRAVGEMGLVALGYACGPLIVSHRLQNLPGLGVIALSLTLCAVGYAPFGVLELPHHMPGPTIIGSVVVLGVVCTAAAFLLFFALIREVGPIRATVITYVNPAVAVALGVGLLGEQFTLGTAVGFTLILLGSFLATQRQAATAV